MADDLMPMSEERRARKAAYNATYRRNNKDKYAAASRRWRDRNPEKVAAYCESTREAQRKRAAAAYERNKARTAARRKAAYKAWCAANPDKVAAYAAVRRASRLQRTPAWLSEDDHWMMEEAYSLAALRSRLTGMEWHVDHIVPLRGATVSGLHVPWNLQVIPATLNLSKRNKWTT